jgi:glycosyltransferase involved in cell wall biosynthesis
MVKTKVSIVIPVLNSHEVLRRQMLYFEHIGIPNDTEIIIVDDGSTPALEYHGELPVTIYPTHDYRPWTWALARNAGAALAKGEYLIFFDIDHIITREIIDLARTFGGQKIEFLREFGVLLEDGLLTQDLNTLVSYGFPLKRYNTRGLRISPLPNNFVMRKDIFFALGGYRKDLIGRPYPQGEDSDFKRKWHNWKVAGRGANHPYRPLSYMFPNGYLCGDVDLNPFGLFHELSRKTQNNYRYRKQISRLITGGV